MAREEIDRSISTGVSIMIGAIIVVSLLLALVLVYGAVTNAWNSYNGDLYSTTAVTNETGAYINSTGYTLDGYNSSWLSTTLTGLINATDNSTIGLGNVTLASGVITNATATNWDDVLVSYTYQLDVTEDTTLNTHLDDTETNVLSMIGNFFEMMPTIGTILAVVILISVILILVMYVLRMRNINNTNDTFSG